MYTLGIDLGTTFTAAAVCRDGHADICPLGSRTAAIPSVVLLREDGSALVGEPANRRALHEPDRVAREFKRRFGDSTPLILGGTPYSPEALTARLLSAVVEEVSTREGGPPSTVCLCHPANWGPFKTDLLQQAVRLADLTLPVTLVTEPEAAAVFYTHEQRIAVGETLGVYDLGGGTFDAAILRRTATGFDVLGRPEGIERLGGIDIDAAVYGHVARALGGRLDDLDDEDPAAVAAVARLRQECTDAKEALSSDTDVTIPVILPGHTTDIRLTRAELETLIRPALYDSIGALRRALASADVTPEQLHSVLLVGGSSRIPLVAQLVGAELARPVAVDAHPKHAVALGAAWLATGDAAAASTRTPSPAPVATPAVPAVAAPATPAPAAPAPATPAPAVLPAAAVAPAARTHTPTIALPAAAPVRSASSPSLAATGSGATVADRSSAGAPRSPSAGDPTLHLAALFPAGSGGGRGPAPAPATPLRDGEGPRRGRPRGVIAGAAFGAVLLTVALVTGWALLMKPAGSHSASTGNLTSRTTAPTGAPTTAVSASTTGSTTASTGTSGGQSSSSQGGTGTVHVVLAQPSGSPGGAVMVQPGNHRCLHDCTLTYQLPATVTLSAQAQPGYLFTPWSGSTCSDVTPCVLHLPRLGTALEVHAGFEQGLLVSVTVHGQGTVSSDDGRINCSRSCSVTYPPNSQVLLHPGNLATFLGWTGCTDMVSGGGCGVSGVPTGTVSLVAAFTMPTATLAPSQPSS